MAATYCLVPSKCNTVIRDGHQEVFYKIVPGLKKDLPPQMFYWKFSGNFSEKLFCRTAAESCFCVIAYFACESNCVPVDIKTSYVYITLKYQPPCHGIFIFRMYIVMINL